VRRPQHLGEAVELVRRPGDEDEGVSARGELVGELNDTPTVL
jgi:hypothetical protein